MFIRAENLNQKTFDEVEQLRNAEMEQAIEQSRRYFEREKQEKMKRRSKYPDFAFKSVKEFTPEEKKLLVDAYYTKHIELLKALGSFAMPKEDVKSMVKEMQEKRRQPADDEELEDMKHDLFSSLVIEDTNTPTLLKRQREDVYFAINKDDILSENFDNLYNFVKQYLEKGMQVHILIDAEMIKKSNTERADYVYSPEEFEQIKKLNNLIAKNGKGEIRIKELHTTRESTDESDFYNTWSLQDVIRANKSLDDVVELIKISKLSPFETMAFIHDYVTSTFAYKEGGLEACRVIPGAFQSGEIVCAGYASMVKAIIDKLDNKDLTCDIVGCSIYKGKVISVLEGGHSHNMIHIRDPKYGIDGVYMEDACWDSKRENFPDGRGFAHCLYPVADLERFRGAVYLPSTSTDRFSNIIMDKANIKSRRVVLHSRLPRPWMTTQYEGQTQPNPMSKYEECLKRVYNVKYDGDQARTDERVDAALRTSTFIAKHEFKHGSSCFASDETYGIKEHGKMSFAENDGRELQ